LSSTSIVNNGTLNFNRSNALTVPGSISGTGDVTQSGTGATTMTGTNSFTGATNVLAGSLTTAAPDPVQTTSDYGSFTFAQFISTKQSLPVAPLDARTMCDFGGGGSNKSVKRSC
jgi:autotransporter-associated beta strand protein